MLFRSPPWDSLVYWALDLETGGLDAKRRSDHRGRDGPGARRDESGSASAIARSSARRTGARITPASVTAHQLVSREVQEAPPLAEVLPEIDRRVREGVLLVHHARSTSRS